MLAPLALVVVATPGCNLDQQGIAPPARTLNFPIALALSVPAAAGEAPERLYVVNSNFDLRFNDGTLMALDLDAVEGEVRATSCTEDTPCEIEDLDQLVLDEVGIGSHGDGIAVVEHGGAERLYIPSRSKRNLVFVDFDGTFECGAMRDAESDTVPPCDELHFHGAEGDVTSERELSLTGTPIDVAAGSLADIGGAAGAPGFVLVAMQGGSVALFVEDESDRAFPTLVHELDGLPDSLVTMTLQPGAGIAWLTSAQSAALSRVGVAVDPDTPLRSFLYDAGAVRLGGIDDGQDNRDIQFDPERPEERAFVLARRPESLVALDLTQQGLNASDVDVDALFEVGAGPSRLALAEVGGRTFAFASTFDARKIFVFDVERGLVAVIGGLSGPFAMAVDSARDFLYLADFSVSVIRVVDLSPLARFEEPFVRATLGEPFVVRRFGM